MSEFVHNLDDVFVQFGRIEAKRMFGGYGIYHNDLMFALVADDELYLKVDDKTIADFEKRKLPQFEYEQRGKKIKMSYYLAPDVIYDDPDEARGWAIRAYEAALRAQHTKKKAKGRKPGKKDLA